MEEKGSIVNRVAQSSLVSLDLEEICPKVEKKIIDLKEFLYEGLIIKEKDFRAQVKNEDWSKYEGCHVGLTCTTDAIIPAWAYMLLASKLEPHAEVVIFGDEIDIDRAVVKDALQALDLEQFKEAKVVVKGCSAIAVKEFAYVEITRLLRPYVSSLMFGEPCSTVPVYKAKKNK